MPLKQGKSKAAFNFNLSDMLHKYQKTGSIGNAKPKDVKAARKQALAIAFSEADK